jgi:hypothetical protein
MDVLEITSRKNFDVVARDTNEKDRCAGRAAVLFKSDGHVGGPVAHLRCSNARNVSVMAITI